jgi:phospholipase C
MVSAAKLCKLPAACVMGLLLILCGCQGLVNGSSSSGNIQAVNHIVFMVQENRSFDNYFGQLPAYWQANGFRSQQFDGISANASNPSYDGKSKVAAYHVATECVQNLSPSWNESHVDWNRTSPTSSTAAMDGFVYNAAVYARNAPADEAPIYDIEGIRAMGYYDGSDLNYYYFMASNFATSDAWFSPAMDRTQINRAYLLAATSQGYAYPAGTNANDSTPLTASTIFDALQKAGISWKVYATDYGINGGDPATYLTMFAPYAPPNQLPSNVVPAKQFLTDAQNGTLPQVAMIEGGYNSGLDEHPKNNVQSGAAYVESLINGLMGSQSWKDSVFILTYDEGGGFYDHVPPKAAVNPDGIAPKDLPPTDICANGKGANCNFDSTGYRVPLIVVSPFTRMNYVSHTAADYTAILKFIETRFNLPSLTKRDAAQMDMTEFFDFKGVPWATAPTPPSQVTTGVCDFQKLQ